jgi:hypothetical protein
LAASLIGPTVVFVKPVKWLFQNEEIYGKIGTDRHEPVRPGLYFQRLFVSST